MLPIDEFEKHLKRTVPRPLAPNVLAAVEARMQEKQMRQNVSAPRSRSSRTVLASVWASGFAIGAAAMLVLAPWLGSQAEQSVPNIQLMPPQARDAPSSIAVVPDVAPEETLVSYPLWTSRDWRARGTSQVLTVGSDPSTIIDSPPIPYSSTGVLDRATVTRPDEIRRGDAIPGRHRSPAPRTRRELIDQILNEV